MLELMAATVGVVSLRGVWALERGGDLSGGDHADAAQGGAVQVEPGVKAPLVVFSP